ncbi:MAG: hypothetical protein L3J71_16800 [Victivallaceae bacterium]|nr:hypothetical protein [Victivallaceae bacterium]
MFKLNFVNKNRILFLILFLISVNPCGAVNQNSSSIAKLFENVNLETSKAVDIKKSTINLTIKYTQPSYFFLHINKPLTMTFLDASNIFLGEPKGRDGVVKVKYNKNREVISLDCGIRSIYEYVKEKINGIEYNTQLVVKIFKKESKDIFSIIVITLEYEMGIDSNGKFAPIAQKLIVSYPLHPLFSSKRIFIVKFSYSNESVFCPATGKVEPCLKFTSPQLKTYSFDHTCPNNYKNYLI